MRVAVHVHLRVDHPEKRDASFRRRTDPHTVVFERLFENRNHALAFAREILAGEWDFASEYVRQVSASEVRPEGGSYGRWVMKMHERRARGAPWEKVV